MSERNLYEVTGDIKDINTLLVSREEWNRRAQPAQAGQVLTDDFIKAEALEAFDCYWDADDETLVNKYGHGVYLSRFIDFARAIEQAVLAKRVPQWRPISTAPNRGPVLLIDMKACTPRQAWGCYPCDTASGGTAMGDWYIAPSVSMRPTHWMPLPPPPGIGGEKGGA